jgi:hypothetical protein
LSEEVERILASHKGQASYVPRTTPVPGSYRSSRPFVERTSVERTSDVQPVAPRSLPPDSERTTAPPAPLKRSKG